jgi:D-3-phosphoglycerate dehydrogenase
MSRPIVWVPEKISDAGLQLLRDRCEIVSAAHDACDAVIVRLFKVTAEEMSRRPKLKVIAKHGVGVDNIDVAAATASGIPVVYTPAANANAVAEHAIALMLALCRRIVDASAAVRNWKSADRSKLEGIELAERTLGVVGLGRIGARVAHIARHGLGMRVLGFDPIIDPKTYDGPATLVGSVDELLPQCDVISLHVPLTDATRNLIGARTLQMLKPTCRIINTSRGAIVDEAALVQALHDGRIAGAALDVFENEPLPGDHPLCTAPNVLLTPHISSSTKESLDRMAIHAAQGVLDVLEGRRPRYAINPEVLK